MHLLKTYELVPAEGQEAYYVKIKKVTQSVLMQIEEMLGQTISRYQLFVKEKQLEKLRTRQEYALDFMMLGTLEMVYKTRACKLKKWQSSLLKKINEKRIEAVKLKKVFSYAKGRLGKQFLFTEGENQQQFSMQAFSELVDYLEATGEFDEMSRRLMLLKMFMEGQTLEVFGQITGQLEQFTVWFKQYTKKHLGAYTCHVADYLKQKAAYYGGREDAVFCTQPEVMYHLNMVGAELLNEAYRTAFKQTKVKYVFVPGCMVYQTKENCQSEKTKKGNSCRGCSQACPVNQVTQLAQSYGAKTTIVYHGSALYRVRRDAHQAKAGLIGIACVLNLLEGGLKAVSLGYVPQCALLNYCGCKAHWDENGIVTQVDMHRIEALLR